jgi:hypothetical protein
MKTKPKKKLMFPWKEGGGEKRKKDFTLNHPTFRRIFLSKNF